MKIKIACFKNARLERKFKTGDKFLLGGGKLKVPRWENFGEGYCNLGGDMV